MKQLDVRLDTRAIHREINRCFRTLREVAAHKLSTFDEKVDGLRRIRQAVYEDLNQIPHAYLNLLAAKWIQHKHRFGANARWSWNPRQTGGAKEPDLRVQVGQAVVVSAEATDSSSPQGIIDKRMAYTLKKLSRMPGTKYYFVRTAAMAERAKGKVARAGYDIRVEIVGGKA